MTVLNSPICTDRNGNTGIPTCIIDPKEIVGAILLPSDQVFSAANVLTASAFITELQTLSMDEHPEDRIYPIFRFEEITDNSEDIVKTTLGYGSTEVTRDGKYNWTFRFTKGGMMYNKSLRKFNHADDRTVLFVDKNNRVYGVDAGSGTMRGFTLEYVHTKPWKIADGSNSTMYTIEFSMAKASELNDDIVFIDAATDIEVDVPGILDIELIEVSTTSTTWVVKVQTLYGKVNLYNQYSTELADPDAWYVTKDGVEVVADTVAVDAVNSAFTLTFTTPTGDHVLQLEDPATLAGLGIGGSPDNAYESDSLEHTFS